MVAVAMRQVTLPLRIWGGIEVPALRSEDGRVFIPVNLLVFALTGSMDGRAYRTRIKRDAILSRLACMLSVQTPGGQQEMMCIERLGLGRLIDRVETGSIRPELQARILEVQWEITHAAYRVLMGEVSEAGAVVSIVPAESLPRHNAGAVSLSDDDVKRYLRALADRIGHIEIGQRELQGLMLALASGDVDAAARSCPQCGYVFGED